MGVSLANPLSTSCRLEFALAHHTPGSHPAQVAAQSTEANGPRNDSAACSYMCSWPVQGYLVRKAVAM